MMSEKEEKVEFEGEVTEALPDPRHARRSRSDRAFPLRPHARPDRLSTWVAQARSAFAPRCCGSTRRKTSAPCERGTVNGLRSWEPHSCPARSRLGDARGRKSSSS